MIIPPPMKFYPVRSIRQLFVEGGRITALMSDGAIWCYQNSLRKESLEIEASWKQLPPIPDFSNPPEKLPLCSLCGKEIDPVTIK